ncbi:MAG: VWA domain-containing protein [Armatimonadota bacterium]|nr:VWA domain-containing protein [Armatimonadota bacterium]
MMLEFRWPALLWALLLVPGLVTLYVRWTRQVARRSVIFSDLATLVAAGEQASRWRRHVAAAAFFLGLGLALVALGRPVFPLPVPADRSAIMLVLDISGSMRSTDIAPNRLEAAKAAARAFLAEVPDQVRVGLVTFGGYATLLAPPGTDHNAIAERLEGLSFIRRTAIGEGLLEAVSALPGRVRPRPDGTLPVVPHADRPPGVVILLSDGRSNTGIDAVRAAEIARQQDVVVHTIGVGNPAPDPSALVIGGSLDESELRAVAQAGGGTYHHASSAASLAGIYKKLARTVGWERRPDEVSAAFALAGAMALVASVTLARWFTHPLGL